MKEDFAFTSNKINKYYNSNKNMNNKIKYLKNLITRVLLSIILFLSICIFMKLDENNLLLVEQYLLEDNLQFTKINKWYQDKFGSIIPDGSNNSDLVFSNDDIKTGKYSNYLDGVKIEMTKGSPVSLLCGGIVVFVGEKEGYGNTLIIQGNDGIDYWYGGITNVSVNLYDYLEKETLIGESLDNFIYLVLEKDGQYLNYEDII